MKNDHSMYLKNHSCILVIKSFITYHENDLKILTITTIRLVPKSDDRIEKYHKIKF